MAQTALAAAEAIAEVTKKADELAVPELRHIPRIEVGQAVRQGDIYIHRVADDHPCGEKLKTRQLAIGTTQGSRHVAEAPAQVFQGTRAPGYMRNALLGPLVRSLKERLRISHPEHAHIDLPPGTYQITHQMDARTLERVQD